MKNKYLVIFMPSIEGGGVEKNLFIIANYFSSKSNNIKLITASNGFDQKFENIDIIKPEISFLKNTSRKLKYLICLLELLKLILSGKEISVFSFQANLYCIILCKIFKIKIIIRSNSSPTGWSKNSLKKFIFKYLLGIADKVIVNSIDFKKQFKVLFNINAKCIYNPLNKSEILKYSKEPIEFPFYKKNKKSLRIITIGRFTDQKDHQTLLKSLNEIKDKINFKLLIIGRGVNKYKISNYIKENNLDSDVLEQTEIQIKYKGYIEKEKRNADKLQRLEDIKIPKNFDYNPLASLSHEAKEKLNKIKPSTLSQASRISGIKPSDISVLLVKMGR